jgi:hypothetical protein
MRACPDIISTSAVFHVPFEGRGAGDKSMSREQFTVGDMKRWLSGFSDSDELLFAGDLTVHRVRRSGDGEAFVEFDQFEAVISAQFKQRHPSVKVIFCEESLDGQAVKMVGVPEI